MHLCSRLAADNFQFRAICVVPPAAAGLHSYFVRALAIHSRPQQIHKVSIFAGCRKHNAAIQLRADRDRLALIWSFSHTVHPRSLILTVTHTGMVLP